MVSYERQLLDASEYVKVFKRDNPSNEGVMPSFPGRGHFQCDCEGIPGLTGHGYYNTISFVAYNKHLEQYDPMWRMVINHSDTWWQERTDSESLKRYICQKAPSFFGLGNHEEYFFSWPMIKDTSLYVRLFNNQHINDEINLSELYTQDYDLMNYDLRLYVWMSKMRGIYIDPMEWNPHLSRPTVEDVRAYNQSRFEEMVYTYKILEEQGDLGPKLTPMRKEDNGGKEITVSTLDSAIIGNADSVENPTSNIFTASAFWNSANAPSEAYWDTEPGFDDLSI